MVGNRRRFAILPARRKKNDDEMRWVVVYGMKKKRCRGGGGNYGCVGDHGFTNHSHALQNPLKNIIQVHISLIYHPTEAQKPKLNPAVDRTGASAKSRVHVSSAQDNSEIEKVNDARLNVFAVDALACVCWKV